MDTSFGTTAPPSHTPDPVPITKKREYKILDLTSSIGACADLDAAREAMVKRARESKAREVEKINKRRKKT